MEGRWESGEHGTQYQVENFMEVVPRTKEGILGYLSSGAIKGIGPKMADTIFRKFGLQTLEIMENNPQELLKIRGISEKKLAAIVESYGKNQVFRELMTFLAPFKVTPKKVNMILKKFGNESVDIIRHRPYMLSAVKGFGFLTVDAIGRQCCCALNDPMRISGCIGHIMNQAMKEGHLFKQRQEVIREALEMLNRDLQVMAVSEQDVSQVLYRLVLQKSIVVEEERIYSIRQYEEETQTASMIARRLLEKPVLLSIEPELEKAQKTLGITLSETQKQAVRMVFAHPISIITGGPGTGKTTVLKVILYIHQALCRSEVQLMAPTGRAARRMVESTGCENASTMHLALGLLGDDTDFEPDFEYLSAGFLNVDEVSMVDMHLAYEFFRRVLELPTTLMDLSVMDNAMARMMLETINNMMLELYASMAQAELEKKEKRQREGIEAKKLRGEWDDYGRPSVMKQETFDENFQSVVSGETTPTQLRKNLGMTHSTFYRYRKTFYEKYPELSNSAN